MRDQEEFPHPSIGKHWPREISLWSRTHRQHLATTSVADTFVRTSKMYQNTIITKGSRKIITGKSTTTHFYIGFVSCFQRWQKIWTLFLEEREGKVNDEMKPTGWAGDWNERLIYIRKDARKPKEKHKQRNKIHIRTRKGQNQHAENQIFERDKFLEKLSKDTAVFKENLKEHEKQTWEGQQRPNQGKSGRGKKPKWDKNSNKAYQKKSLSLESVGQGKISVMGEAEVENKLTLFLFSYSCKTTLF